MNYRIEDIARIIDADQLPGSSMTIEQILIDSRKVYDPANCLFFALKGPRRDGHQFIPELYQKGIRAFVVTEIPDRAKYPGAFFLPVFDTLQALQALAAYHRSRFTIPVIGVTGSNGKTVVKEWLWQLLHEDYRIVRSPKSYNSQVGVPLSLWQMDASDELGIFEAGISEQGEMPRLERMIRPTIGLLTNIGEAHSEGFIDSGHKFREKMTLFRHCKALIGRDIDFEGRKEVLDMMREDLQWLSWGTGAENHFVVKETRTENGDTLVRLEAEHTETVFRVPFTDAASIENAIHCACVMLYLGTAPETIRSRMPLLHPVNMRLELKKGNNHCLVINDSYSADTSSLEIALNFLEQQNPGMPKTVILSDFLQSALPDSELYERVAEQLRRHQLHTLIGIGERISTHLPALMQDEKETTLFFYPSTAAFLSGHRISKFREEAILVKGARVFEFEKIVQVLELKAHQTVLEINLSALAHNLKQYQQIIQPRTKVMAMVKAFAYGSGGAEIAGILQYHKADYLGVAYADEGVELRKAGISLPIMVMNPEEASFENIVRYQLEPELYSFAMLEAFDQYLRQEGLTQYPVHIEIETGMNRLGFSTAETDRLAAALTGSSSFRLQSVFSHLAASEDAGSDDFTNKQFELFNHTANRIRELTGVDFLRHIANSAAAIRHPHLQLDMIRIGIGLYGVDSAASGKLDLQTVATLKSGIAQIKQVAIGESVSYNRKWEAARQAVIATIRLGYADGFPRRLSNGVGQVWIRNQKVPVIGTVCMDMFMADVTDIPGIQEGEEVIIFGHKLPVEELARAAGTIPYEIMTGISQRVKRVYFEE